MDLTDAMKYWKEIEGELISWNKTDGYYCLFVKHGKVQGYTKAQAGGISWDWPQELMDYYNKVKKVA